jgi:glutathione peroxidase
MQEDRMANTIFQLAARKNDGSELPFSGLEGNVLLIVNTASKCGFTPQYKGLEELHRKYKDRGLEVLGFPCDQFAHQEPGGDGEIAAFCQRNFGVTFPLMSKVKVNGLGTHPVFKFLKSKAPGAIGKTVKWNFTKFLVARDGKSVTRFASSTEPSQLEKDIEAALAI